MSTASLWLAPFFLTSWGTPRFPTPFPPHRSEADP